MSIQGEEEDAFWGETKPVGKERASLKGRVDSCAAGLDKAGTEGGPTRWAVPESPWGLPEEGGTL